MNYLKQFCAAVLCVAILSIATGCSAASDPSLNRPDSPAEAANSPEPWQHVYLRAAEPLSREERQLYADTVEVLLEEDLWTARDAYDAGHSLMLPMHCAFWTEDEAAIGAFSAFFTRFAETISGDSSDFWELSQSNQLNFMYLASQYMALCCAYDRQELLPVGLSEAAEACAETYLLDTPANWDVEPTVLELIRQVLAGKTYRRSFDCNIGGLEWLSLAILCDLRCVSVAMGEEPGESEELAADLVYQIFSSPLLNEETEDGGWLYQVGVWSEYPDFAYAGNQEITPGMEPNPREDIVWDSSHFHRMPLHLNSYLDAQTLPERRELFVLRKQQLANQMAEHVLQKVDGLWLATTFMDGTNGVYRYSYHEEGVGIAGYDLSETVLLGWWALLDDPRITEIHREILREFPMEAGPDNPYWDGTTVREQNPFFDSDTAFGNGMYECMTMCAGKMEPAS